MAKVNVSVSELRDVLQKAGLPFGNKEEMQEALPFAPEMIEPTVRGQYQPAFTQLRGKYQQGLKQIADLDAKLAGIYGNPTSPYYIERPTSRESLIGRAQGLGYKGLESIGEKMGGLESEIESKTSQAESYYRSLISQAEKKASKAGTSLSEMSSLQDIFPGMDFGEFNDPIQIFKLFAPQETQERPPIESFEEPEGKPPIRSFDTLGRGIDILRQPIG